MYDDLVLNDFKVVQTFKKLQTGSHNFIYDESKQKIVTRIFCKSMIFYCYLLMYANHMFSVL